MDPGRDIPDQQRGLIITGARIETKRFPGVESDACGGLIFPLMKFAVDVGPEFLEFIAEPVHGKLGAPIADRGRRAAILGWIVKI